MTAAFFVPGPLPGMNEMIAAAKSGRGAGNAYSRQKALWTSVVARHVRSRQIRHFVSPVRISCIWHEATKRRDPDNVQAAIKFVLDGMVEAGLIDGDGHSHVVSIQHEVVVGGIPGVSVVVEGDQ